MGWSKSLHCCLLCIAVVVSVAYTAHRSLSSGGLKKIKKIRATRNKKKRKLLRKNRAEAVSDKTAAKVDKVARLKAKKKALKKEY